MTQFGICNWISIEFTCKYIRYFRNLLFYSRTASYTSVGDSRLGRTCPVSYWRRFIYSIEESNSRSPNIWFLYAGEYRVDVQKQIIKHYIIKSCNKVLPKSVKTFSGFCHASSLCVPGITDVTWQNPEDRFGTNCSLFFIARFMYVLILYKTNKIKLIYVIVFFL